MKNMRKFLALSLLLSIPSMKYAMENNVGQQVGESMASNIGNTMEIGGSVTNSGADAAGKASENVANQVVENTADQSWFSNPMNWNLPSMSDLGLQQKWEKAGSYLQENLFDPALNAYETYGVPGMQQVASGVQSAKSFANENIGKPVWNTAAGMYEGAGSRLAALNEGYIIPHMEKSSKALQPAVSFANENIVLPGYKFYGNNQDSVEGLGLLAGAIGAWILYQRMNPSLTDAANQEILNKYLDENADNIEQVRSVMEAKTKAAEAARLAEAERVAKLSYVERARELAGQYYPSGAADYIRSLSPWRSSVAAITEVGEQVAPSTATGEVVSDVIVPSAEAGEQAAPSVPTETVVSGVMAPSEPTETDVTVQCNSMN